MNEAEEDIEGAEFVEEEDGAGDEEEESDCDDGGSQPLDFSSEEIRLRIIESGTKLPDCIAASAWRPRGGFKTCARKEVHDIGLTHPVGSSGGRSLATNPQS